MELELLKPLFTLRWLSDLRASEQDLLSAPLKVLSIKELLLWYSSSLTFPPSQRPLLLIPFPCTLQSLNPILLLSHSVMSGSATPWTAAHQVSLCFTISWSLLRHMSIELAMPFNHLTLCHSTFSSCLQSFPASGSFPMRQLFTSGGQSFGASASASVLPTKNQG